MGPYKFELRERNVLLRMGKHFNIAIVINCEENKTLLDKSSAIILDIQERYGDVFYNWKGNLKDVEGRGGAVTASVERPGYTDTGQSTPNGRHRILVKGSHINMRFYV